MDQLGFPRDIQPMDIDYYLGGPEIHKKIMTQELDDWDVDDMLEASHLIEALTEQYKVQAWGQKVIDRYEEIKKCFDFFQSVVKDWTNRTLVINEYHLAKTKGKIMYWFVSFSDPDYHLDGHPLLEYRFENYPQRENTSRKIVIFITAEAYLHGYRFHEALISQLFKRSFLSMILNSKAAKHEDRFHAILPLSRYRHVLEDKNTAVWNFDDGGVYLDLSQDQPMIRLAPKSIM
ncbi:hypothetical protein BC941DRAFT_498028 [Chlamydoabsidia padenii]|nr:hypothetical protein BC941DRAFT_498028 [Chlamydoabsidia padenii]